MNNDIKERAKEIVSGLTLRQKAQLLYGRDFWFVRGSLASEELPDIMVTDGPSGLRKQLGKPDMLGIHASVPATAFPTASCIACSWDPALAEEMGKAMGEECVKEDVAVLLGPGANHKRDPLCGRNFEYSRRTRCSRANSRRRSSAAYSRRAWGPLSNTSRATPARTRECTATASSMNAPSVRYISSSTRSPSRNRSP